jgi:hypothetical protein
LWRQHLVQTYSWQWIGRRCPVNETARSCDLNPLDFSLWGHSNTVVYSEPINYLQQRVDNACLEMRIKRGIFERICSSVLPRAESWHTSESHRAPAVETHENLPYLSGHWSLDLWRLGLLCSFKWVLYTLKPVTLSFNILYKKLRVMSLNYLRTHFSRFTRTGTCL